MGAYLALRVASMPMLLFFSMANRSIGSTASASRSTFILYWAVYIASAVFLFFVCMEVFRSALSAFPGLMKFGIVIFRWAVLASVIVSFSTISFSHRGVLLIPNIAFG